MSELAPPRCSSSWPDTESKYSSEPPRVTVVITTYNRPDLLQIAVESALRQSFRDFELIVLDDGSHTDTEGALSRFSDPRLTLVRNEKNLGINVTMQRGFSFARHEFFVLFADDDALHPDFLATCVSALDSEPFAIAACVRSWLMDEAGEVAGVPELEDSWFEAKALRAAEFAHAYFTQSPVSRMYIAATLFRAALLSEHSLEYPDQGFTRCSDDLFLAQIASTERPIVMLPERLYYRRFHPAMNSSASPGVIDELLAAALIGRNTLSGTGEMGSSYATFVIQSALQVTRDMPYRDAALGVRAVRAALKTTPMKMRDVLHSWGWRRQVEFSTRLGFWLVRRTQRMRLRETGSK